MIEVEIQSKPLHSQLKLLRVHEDLNKVGMKNKTTAQSGGDTLLYAKPRKCSSFG